MENTTIGIIVALVSLAVSLMTYPLVLRYARAHGIVDNPNARKLQRVPVPVMGGVVVYAGILVGGLLLDFFLHSDILIYGLIGMTVMMLIGVWDDMKDISAKLRFLIEILLVTMFILVTDTYIDDFHGLWGIHELPDGVAYPLSIVAGVGIINAINLIDGVDGYSSGYGMMASACFGIAFWTVWSPVMTSLTLVVIAALLPFFLHNVFGAKSKMFIGDGGTLMLGMLMTVYLFFAMSSNQQCDKLADEGIGLGAFTLAVLCIPIGDTLRVMTMRVLRGRSPFSPDKTHLHHLFIDMGFSHLGAALFIIFINFMVVLVWLASWKLGASVDVQLYIVIVLGLAVTFGFYRFMKVQQNGGPVDEEGYPQGTKLWHLMYKVGNWTHREKKRSWRILKEIVDGPLMGGVK
jgi:UDP-N-acetylmuramyl pentapeptide phosphotransferase/UDP-N-acetylglucosamine-1-phosphate transferase